MIDPSQEQVELRLTSIEIEGIKLNPEFNSETFEYHAEVVNLDELKVTAISNVEDANIEIIGNTGLIEGENLITIKVTKDEKITEYKIKVNKTISAEEEKTSTEEEGKKVGFIGWINNWWNTSGPMSIAFTIILLLLGVAVIFAIISYRYSNSAQTLSKHARIQFTEENHTKENKNK